MRRTEREHLRLVGTVLSTRTPGGVSHETALSVDNTLRHLAEVFDLRLRGDELDHVRALLTTTP